MTVMHCARLFHGFWAGMMLLLLAGSACTIEEGDEVPRRTGTEHGIYSWVSGLDAEAVGTLRVAAGFDEWLRQTTSEGREEVCTRFFSWARVYDEGENHWSLQGSGLRYDFELRDGLGLGEPGASWLVTERVNGALRSTSTLAAADDGELRCDISAAYWNTYILYDAAWSVRMTVSKEVFDLSVSGSAEMRLESEQGGIWTVGYELTDPLVWSEQAGETVRKGAYAFRAAYAGATERLLEFRVVQSALGRVTITSGDVTEVW